jgi:hypothetical protein
VQRARVWEDGQPEPAGWLGTDVTSTFANGQFGVMATDDIFQFDDVILENSEETT